MIYCSSLDIIFFERQRKKYNHERLLDMEIVALQSKLAKFILAIAQSVKYQIIVRSPRSIAQSVKSENISFFILRDRDLDKNIWTVTVTFVMFNIDGLVVYAYIKRNPIPQKNIN